MVVVGFAARSFVPSGVAAVSLSVAVVLALVVLPREGVDGQEICKRWDDNCDLFCIPRYEEAVCDGKGDCRCRNIEKMPCEIPYIVNGKIKCSSSSRDNHVLRCDVTCLPGYGLRGANRLSCLGPRQWSHPKPYCVSTTTTSPSSVIFPSSNSNSNSGAGLCQLSPPNDYSYEQRYDWPDLYPSCGGRRQSPIDIDLSGVERVRFSSELDLSDYRKRIQSAKLENDGHTAVTEIGENIVVTGGPVKNSRFQLGSFHMHFGKYNTQGSEHTVNGNSYDMEFHFVHRNTKYSSMGVASKQKDGLLVIALLVEVDRNSADNQAISFLTESLQRVKDPRRSNSTVVRGINLSAILPNKGRRESYYTYAGSLTTPTCDESVTWVVLKQVLVISESQMNRFRHLLDRCGRPLAGNIRPAQRLNGRLVAFVR